MQKHYFYPFVAVTAQEKVKKALVLNVINPLIGGVLISGEKGTAKSTLVRGLSEVMEHMEVVNLPLNVTEDRLVGTIDIQKAIMDGKRTFEPGILKEADGNILYVDEVNLLSENIVNCLLEVSSSGINYVEREGISYKHSSNFILVGTMNPEEGHLRSQFLDRFGLYLEVKGSTEVNERKEIIKRRLEYEKNPVEYVNKFKEETHELCIKILSAKEFIHKVKISESVMNLAAQLSQKANCAGHRAELVIIETSKAIAAFANRNNITVSDIKEAAELALPHRMRQLPPKPSQSEEAQTEEQQNNNNNNNNNNDNNNNNNCTKEREPYENSKDNDHKEEKEQSHTKEEKSLEDNNEKNGHKENTGNNNSENNQEQEPDVDADTLDDIGRTFVVKSLNIKPMDRKNRKGSGKRNRTNTNLNQGRYIKYTFPKNKFKDIDIVATIRVAAPYQSLREKNGLAISINKSDFREKSREKRTGSTILFVVDASGSMGAKKRMEAAKGAILSLLTDAYEKRDKVGMIVFRKKQAELLLGITRSIDLAQKSLKTLPTGGKTPLAQGLIKTYEILIGARKKDPHMVPVIVLVSDGRTNSSVNGGDPFIEAVDVAKKIASEGIQSIVIDTEQDFIKLGLAVDIAKAMNAQYYKLEDLEADHIAGLIRGNI